MSPQTRDDVERAIGRVLLDQWDPLSIHDDPERENVYSSCAHELYGLLARGASDVQIARHLHSLEREGFQHPELGDRDLRPLVQALRRLVP
jgi:hypothetical protein